jgi:hypothetical protein
MHLLVHTWARDVLNEAEERKWLLLPASILAASLSWGKGIFDYRFRRSLMSHVVTCLKLLSIEILFAVSSGEEERLRVARKFSKVCNENGQWQAAVDLNKKVLEASKKTLGDEHPNALLSVKTLEFYFNNLSKQTHFQNYVLHPALQPTEQVGEKQEVIEV